ncbi:hypothetical protein SAMN05216312_102309 [Cohnella sp. OV330]|uniref:hypothetical protein n=1 Tax=Cohnella sp. OV330 TaxID=1855288 RepID=UPI0008E7D514|nr:hypothetical protein [Cohnella sp. OV330]SFA92955.1 hypothetical protein SAMN05216312_102309 [Cohnella sp. OV330]
MKLTLLLGIAAVGLFLFAYIGCKAMLAHGRKSESAGFLALIAWSAYMGLANLNEWPSLTLISLQQSVINPAGGWLLHLIHYR